LQAYLNQYNPQYFQNPWASYPYNPQYVPAYNPIYYPQYQQNPYNNMPMQADEIYDENDSNRRKGIFGSVVKQIGIGALLEAGGSLVKEGYGAVFNSEQKSGNQNEYNHNYNNNNYNNRNNEGEYPINVIPLDHRL
jgi:hypothetical protein